MATSFSEEYLGGSRSVGDVKYLKVLDGIIEKLTFLTLDGKIIWFLDGKEAIVGNNFRQRCYMETKVNDHAIIIRYYMDIAGGAKFTMYIDDEEYKLTIEQYHSILNAVNKKMKQDTKLIEFFSLLQDLTSNENELPW
ncbi:MAG: hypothetical protein LBR31_02505 [Desulfovibrio sp.]|jgi:hypothetical protein|nr:hypothetical protein [Desulfovibrio sp.]